MSAINNKQITYVTMVSLFTLVFTIVTMILVISTSFKEEEPNIVNLTVDISSYNDLCGDCPEGYVLKVCYSNLCIIENQTIENDDKINGITCSCIGVTPGCPRYTLPDGRCI